MQGLLDFIKTPEGQGLLSAAAGAMAGARPGQPWNTMGRGGLAGIAGYANALDRQTQQEENAVQKRYRDMQMTGMQRQLDKQAREDTWRTGLTAKMQPTPVELDQFTGTTVMQPADPQSLQQYLMHPDSPWADDVMKSIVMKKPAEGFTLSPGEVRYGPDGKVIVQGPAKPDQAEDDPKITQYKYAKANGYKGTFEQFVVLGPALMAAAAAPLRDAQIGNINAENAYNLPPPMPQPRPSQSGATTVSAGGKTYTFPNAAAAAAFKKQAGIQ